MTLAVLDDAQALAAAAADRFVDSAQRAMADRGTFRVALSGGSTPRAVYGLLARPPRIGAVDWSRVEFLWGDERAVPPDHPESNFGVAYQMLIAHLPGLLPTSIHRMLGEAPDLDAAAMAYEADLRLAFAIRAEELPAFDLIWLGMGPDGHTASLFPGSAALDVTDRLVIATYAPGPAAWRLTLTLPVLNAAREVMFVVGGADKAGALRAVLKGEGDLPAARVAAARTDWLVDAAAAGELAAR